MSMDSAYLRALGRQPAQTGGEEQSPVPVYSPGQQFPVEPTSGLPILAGSPYAPPPVVSESEKFGVASPLEKQGLLSFIPGFFNNILHNGFDIVKGITSLGGMVGHDLWKGLASTVIPGEQSVENDGWHTWDRFIVPMTGWGDAESALVQDYKYRYGLSEFAKGDILGGLGKFFRGLYEQPVSFLSDVTMAGGAVGKSAEIAARLGEAGFAARTLGEAAINVSKEGAAIARKSHIPLADMPGLATEAQRAALAAAERPNWLKTAQNIANLEPGDVLGSLRGRVIEVPVGIGDNIKTIKLTTNPIRAMNRKMIFRNKWVSSSFGQLDDMLRAVTGGVGYDEITNMPSSKEVQDAFATLGAKSGEARAIYQKMSRLIDNVSDKGEMTFKYERAFRPYADKLFENSWFSGLRSAAATQAIERRKRFIAVIKKDADALYEDYRARYPNMADEEINKAVINTIQGTVTDRAAAELLDADLAANGGVINNLDSEPVKPLDPLPPQYRVVNNEMPEGITRDYTGDEFLEVRRAALEDTALDGVVVGKGVKESVSPVARIPLRVAGGYRNVFHILVGSYHDITPMIEKVAQRMGGTVEYVYDTLRNPELLNSEQRLVRAVVAGVRKTDGSLVEIAPMTGDMLRAAHGGSTLTEILSGLEDNIAELFGTQDEMGNLIPGRIDKAVAELKQSEEYLKRLEKQSIDNPVKGDSARNYAREIADTKKQIRIRSKRLRELQEESVSKIDNIYAAREFGRGLNEIVDNQLKWGNNYNPARKFRDRMALNWWNEVMHQELGGEAGHLASMNFSQIMNRAYGIQRITKAESFFEQWALDLERYLRGDLAKEILRLDRRARIALADRMALPPPIRLGVIAGDVNVINKTFGALMVGSRDEAIKAITAFVHMYKYPTEAAELVIKRFLSGTKEGEALKNLDIYEMKRAFRRMRLPKESSASGKKVVSLLSGQADFNGNPLWAANGVPNPTELAQTLKDVVKRHVGPTFFDGDVEGFRWHDLHRDWTYGRGEATPIYFPHLLPSESGKMVMNIAADRISSVHPRAVGFINKWDGELLRRGVYDTNFAEAYAHKAVQLIRHQEVYDLFKQMKKFSRVVSPHELELFDRGWMKGEKLWNPELVDSSFRLSKRARQQVLDLVAGGMTMDEATATMLRDILPDSIEAAMRNSTGELYAVPTYLADQIERAARLNLGWQVRLLWDSPLQVWRSSALALSPRWIVNNLLGNTYFQMLKNPAAIVETIRMLDDEYKATWEHLSGGRFPAGVDRGLFFEQGNIITDGKYGYAEEAAPRLTKAMKRTMEYKPVNTLSRGAEAMRELQGRIEDTFRRGTFAAEYKKLYKKQLLEQGRGALESVNAMEKIMSEGVTPELAGRALEGVNKILGNYTNLGAWERQIFRRFFMPFYAFYRHAVKFTVSLPFTNPLKATVLRQLDTIDREYYGDSPDWFSGSFFVGQMASGDPLFVRTGNMNPLEGVIPGATGLLGNMNPVIRAAFERMTGISTMNGRPFTSADVFETPTGHRYRFERDEQGNAIGVSAMDDMEKVLPPWLEQFFSAFPQYNLIQRGIIDPIQGETGAKYSTGGTIMEGGKPKYENAWWSAWLSFFGVPTTNFDPNNYVFDQYKDYWETALPMAQSRVNDQSGVQP